MQFSLRLWMILVAFSSLLPFQATGQSVSTSKGDPLDWPHWLGPQQNRTSLETGLVDRWDPKGGPGSNLLWKNTELAGRSTPIVMRGKLTTIARDQAGLPNEGAKVVCVDAATGKKIWEHRYNVYLSDVPDTRVGWSSCTGDPETGRIYVQSVSGYFCCLEGETGQVVWSRSLHEEFGLLSTFGGRTNVPVVFEETVLVSAVVIGWGDSAKWGSLAKPAHRFMAFDKATGELRWLRGTRISPYDTTYSTPTIAVFGGQAALVFGSGDGAVWALQPHTGLPIWQYPFSRRGLNVSPLVVGSRVYTSHSEENLVGNTMGALVALDSRAATQHTAQHATQHTEKTLTPQWQQLGVMAGKSSPVMVDGRLWIVDDRAKLQVIDPETGRLIARKALGTVMRSTPLVADGKVYLCTNNGRWYILKPTDSGVEVIHKLRLSGHGVDGSPIVSHGRIYLPTSEGLYCIGREKNQPTAKPQAAACGLADESPLAEDSTPAHLQVVPYDVLLAPGEKQSYRVRVYNARGQLLREAPAESVQYTVDGPGQIGPDGTYTAAGSNEHSTARIVCQAGQLQGTARVRVVPPLPWDFDFSRAEKVPLTWIGGRVRYVLREVDGEQVVVKRSVLPTPRDPNNKLGTRSRLWMGSAGLANYTIQADVRLTEEGGKLPDVGLINSRYTMTLRGMNHQVRLYSWSPHDYRTFASVEFQPQPDVWYSMKFSVEPAGNEAIVRGKLWPRGEKEPKEWTIEMVDKSPNLTGSPGLYGNAQEAEFFINHIRVTSNTGSISHTKE